MTSEGWEAGDRALTVLLGTAGGQLLGPRGYCVSGQPDGRVGSSWQPLAPLCPTSPTMGCFQVLSRGQDRGSQTQMGANGSFLAELWGVRK